jgi:hypothetical protein
MGDCDWFATAQAQYDNELPPYLDNESDEDEFDDEED